MTENVIYYLRGTDAYLIDRKVESIIEDVTVKFGEDPEVVLVDADELSNLELGQTLEFSPLFALSRIVIIKKPVWLGKGTRKIRKNEEVLQVLEDYCQHDNHGQVLVITASERNAGNAVNKYLEKHAQVMDVPALSPMMLEQWCAAELARNNLSAVPAVLNRMSNSGQDMYYLQNLITKLSLMAATDKISLSDIEEQLDSKQDIKVFKLTDALLNRNLRAALNAYYQLQEQGEPDLKILYMISRQFVNYSKVKFYKQKGYSSIEIAKLTQQKDFAVKKMVEKSSQFSAAELRFLFEKILETDTSFKSQNKDPRLLMETLLIDFCGK